MTHDKRFENQDIHDLIALIKGLEERILELELQVTKAYIAHHTDDRWYWEHG